MGSATSRSTTPRTAIRLGARSPRRRSSPICLRSNEHTAYGSLGYLFGPNMWLLLHLVLLKWDIQDVRDIYLPHGWFLFLVVHGQWGFPVAHCLTGSDLSAHLFHFGLQVSVLPEGHLGWDPSAQG